MTYVTGTVLTDEIYLMFGGDRSTSNEFQRQAAYAIAEQQATLEIKTFLTPTIFTGTYSWPGDSRLQLYHTHLNRVISVTAVHDAGCDCADDGWIVHHDCTSKSDQKDDWFECLSDFHFLPLYHYG